MFISIKRLEAAGFEVKVTDEGMHIGSNNWDHKISMHLERLCDRAGLGPREHDEIVGVIGELQVIKAIRS